MAHHPFAESFATSKNHANRRRSTRVNAAVPIILSGRDASGQAFRDETYTVILSLHGALLQTPRQLLVGMQVTIECPRTGMSEKAICIHSDDPVPGVAVHTVAVQLVRPGNIWGLENPPADWQITPAAPRQGQASAAAPVVAQPVATATLAAAQVTALEQQATQISDAAVVRLRGLVEEMLGTAFEDFQRRLDSALAGAEERLEKRSAAVEQQVAGTVEAAVERLRGPVEKKLQTVGEDFQHRLDARLAAANERIDKRTAELQQQALTAFEGTAERLRIALEELLGAAIEDFQPRLDVKLAAAEERLDQHSTSLEQQVAATVEGAVERLRAPVEEKLAASTADFQQRLDARLTAAEERIDKRSEALDQQATALVERAMERLKGPIEEKLAAVNKDFQQLLDARLSAAEGRITQHSDESLAQLDDALKTFRRDLEDELNARREEAVASTEQALRARIPSLMASIFALPGAAPPSPNPESKK